MKVHNRKICQKSLSVGQIVESNTDATFLCFQFGLRETIQGIFLKAVPVK